MKKRITDINQLDLKGNYTYADYLTWRFDQMVEIIKGKVFKMSPAPSRFHQDISVNLTLLLGIRLKSGPCKLYHAPTDVRLLTKGKEDKDIISVVQPDIFVVCDAAKMDDKGCLGSPDFIIEIVSPGTSTKDLSLKFNLYEGAGVKEYWIIFPNDQIIECFFLENGAYKKSGVYAEDAVVPVLSIPGLELKVEEIFER
jgi:Uma2 family endonuclease